MINTVGIMTMVAIVIAVIQADMAMVAVVLLIPTIVPPSIKNRSMYMKGHSVAMPNAIFLIFS